MLGASPVVVANPSAMQEMRRCGFDPWSGRSQGGGNGNPFWYFCLKNSMDRGAWWATVYGVTKSRTRLSMHTSTWSLLKFLNVKRREISVGGKPEMLYLES